MAPFHVIPDHNYCPPVRCRNTNVPKSAAVASGVTRTDPRVSWLVRCVTVYRDRCRLEHIFPPVRCFLVEQYPWLHPLHRPCVLTTACAIGINGNGSVRVWRLFCLSDVVLDVHRLVRGVI